MATTTPVFNPDALYDVQLARPIKVGRTVILPVNRVQLKGKVVEANMADILDASEIKS
ncbi:hypothetical protein LH464_04420 [Neorhizobium sp. T786]|uniref:hypothetical protein n=1 Tax=Pseudorhizobium xiangyangii TaxID=2883104 RepID=UPI001CFFB998|nr:hypothetical protein [Neorhizobium xiangyangii]MCB5201723.1 hypothetical protein [Neorhizobium xiangyangii]